MEFFLTVVLVVGLVVFVHGQNKKARRQQAASFTYHHDDVSWVVNFATSRMLFQCSALELVDDSDTEYELRREPNGRWCRRMTNDSWAREFQRARASFTNNKTGVGSEIGRNLAKGRLAELGDAPAWEPVPDLLVPMIESHYQTYQDVLG
jgi:hypothetical protein